MAKKVKKSVLGAKIKKKIDKSSKEEREFTPPKGGGDWPNGIENGIAQVTALKIDLHKEDAKNAGKPYFLMQGVAVSPESVNGETVATRNGVIINEPLYDTPTRSRKTEDEHLDYMVDVIKNLGVEEVDGEALDDGSLFAELVGEDAEPIYVKFRTWKGDKPKTGPYKDREPQVQVSYMGKTEWNGEVATETVDESGGDDGDDAPWEADSVMAELDDYAKRADTGNDADAEEAIAKLAGEHDIDHESYDKWSEVADAIREAAGSDDGDGDDDGKPALEETSFEDHGTLVDDNEDEDSEAYLREKAEEFKLDPDDYETWNELGVALTKASKKKGGKKGKKKTKKK